jgi:hypothetical protein
MIPAAIPVVDSADLAAAIPVVAAPRAIGKDMERKLTELVDRLKKSHGERLVSVVLYGSAAGDDHVVKFSDLNILCVLSEVTPRELGQSEPVFRWWHDQGNPAPLLLSEHEVATSTDCFPIEFHDMTRQHRLLHGKDVIGSLRVDNSFYRAQVEHELRAKMLRLRQKASGILSEPELLRKLLADSISTFCVLFRHALMLHGKEPRMNKREVIEQTRSVLGIDSSPFDRLLDLREDKIKPKDLDPAAMLGPYLKEISVVIDAVDGLEK